MPTISITVLCLILGINLSVIYPAFAQQDTSLKSQEYFASQEECEKSSELKCSFLMCDFIPEGSTYEETCRDSPTGWYPQPKAAEPTVKENTNVD